MIHRKPNLPTRSPSRHLEVDVKGDDVMKAWRKLKKKLMRERILEEVKERRYYKKPSIAKREKSEKARRAKARLEQKRQRAKERRTRTNE